MSVKLPESRGLADSHVTRYRPDVDGLRAVAVIAVIVFHLSAAALPGGYFGVDIFFVLSGYLITSIIWREITLGQFTMARFYERRVRRIMPALLLVLLVTSVASIAVLLPIDLIGFAKSLFATLGFGANVYFWRDTYYFSRIAEEKPLLHMWSLGVEEQFYLLFPLFLVVIARWARKAAGLWLTVLLVASLGLDMALLRAGGVVPAFYLFPTRAWELALGALVALAPREIHIGRPIRELLGWAGAALLVFGLTADRIAFPLDLPDALPVVLGTGLLVWAGTAGEHALGRVLAWRGAVFVGLISYSLYLWHWPIIVLWKYYLVRPLGRADAGVAVVAMSLMSALSWRYVERPFRSSAMPFARAGLWTIAGMAAAAAIGAAIIATRGFPSRLNTAAARLNASVGTNYRCAMSAYLLLGTNRACVLNLRSRNPNDADVVLLGNSHAQMYAPVVEEVLRERSLNGLLVPANGCLPTYGTNISRQCVDIADRNIDAVSRLARARIVLIGTTWDDRLTSAVGRVPADPADRVVFGLDATISRLQAAGKRVVLIGPIATPKWDVASVASRSLAFGRPLTRPLYVPEQQFMREFAAVIRHYEARRDVVFIRPDLVQCSQGRCFFVQNGRSLFADDNHLAAAELQMFKPQFEQALERAGGR